MGPQLIAWQEVTDLTWPEFIEHGKKWQPDPLTQCLPPNSTLAVLPYDDTTITTGMDFALPGCYGPNNCFADGFKQLLAGIIFVYILANHLFVKLVLLGPVARTMRRRQKEKDEQYGDGGGGR